VAIVDHFRELREHRSSPRRHYRGLKMYAANDENVINASVEFDEKTLQPTYKLLIGWLARRRDRDRTAVWIDQNVIDSARENLDTSPRKPRTICKNFRLKLNRPKIFGRARRRTRGVAMKYAGLEVEASRKKRPAKGIRTDAC
jgi:DNA mismatch repair protein MutS2